jgi:alpha-ketoglutarate-dependent taurine dioxygenase
MPELTIRKLHPVIGAEVTGIDLAEPVDDATKEALSQALSEHLALVFPHQELTPDQYLNAGSAFGPVMRQHYSQHHMPGHPLIGLVHHQNGQRPAERWHTDHTNHEKPPLATMLYGVEIPSAGGGTSIASMRAAYDALSDGEQQRLCGMRSVNMLDIDREGTRAEDEEKYGKPVVHPMVRTHPVHGSRAVYFHITKVQYIEGMSEDLSRAYMENLLDRMIRPEITYQHQWKKGDVLIFDDRATLHRAHGDYDRSESRVLWRILVEGDRPRLV